MILRLRILRGIIGVFTLALIKASYQPGFEFLLEGNIDNLKLFLFRCACSILGFLLFSHLRNEINSLHIKQNNEPNDVIYREQKDKLSHLVIQVDPIGKKNKNDYLLPHVWSL